ncbi:hypothetical protein BDR05DRAFT_949144 [Suillus weaverae]|nr:hypothetical protein BDR05DRAFT_949144 [Suillus weaverae]
MSQHLLQAKYLSINTSFKCAQGWQEFEIESWDVDHTQSVVGAQAFMTSQTAKAHVILFQHIFKITSADTGLPIMFHHIHGASFEAVIADSHKGQGLAWLRDKLDGTKFALPVIYQPASLIPIHL